MKSSRFDRWMKKIYLTEDEEISCTECFDLVSSFVEIEASGGDPTVKMPKVIQHLHQCDACREEYETLRDLRLMEEEGRTPSIHDLEDLIH